MSQMSTKPVFRCKYCGKPVVIALLMTKTPDPESKLLFSLMPGLKTIAMCKDCKKKYNWYALQNRTQDFIAGKP